MLARVVCFTRSFPSYFRSHNQKTFHKKHIRYEYQLQEEESLEEVEANNTEGRLSRTGSITSSNSSSSSSNVSGSNAQNKIAEQVKDAGEILLL